MDDQNESLKDRWRQPGHVPERAYASEDAPLDRRTTEIRSDIEQTRADMSETVDAIQERLRPGNVVANATESVRNATVGRVKEMARGARETFRGDTSGTQGEHSGMIEHIREHPFRAALAAASLAWVFSGRRSRRRVSPAIYGSARDGEPFIRETVIHEDDEARGMSAASGVSDLTHRAQSTVRESSYRVREAASTTSYRMQRLMRENPLAAGALAVVAGATVGLTLPETRRENELMGEARDSVVNRAQEVARDAAERVQEAAGQVQDVAREAAKKVIGREE